VAVSFPIAFEIAEAIPWMSAPETTRVTILNGIFLGLLVLFFFNREGLYRWDVFVRVKPLVRRLVLAIATSAVVYPLIRLFVSPDHNLAYVPFLLLYFVVCFCAVFGMRLAVRFVEINILKCIRTEHVAFAGWSSRMEKVLIGIAREMKQFHTMQGYIVVDSHPESVPDPDKGYREIGRMQNLQDVLEANKVTMLIVEQRMVTQPELRLITSACADAMVNLRIIPAAFDIWTFRLSVRALNGVPILGINDLQYDHYGNKLLKRMVDICGSLVGLCLSVPVIAILAILIRRESPGPIFYKQTRLGLRDKPFEMYKLRSMRTDAEVKTGAVWTVENDPRRTKIGAFMRKWNLDELPQFWNVLRGEMSLVGPRPERPEFVEDFRDEVRYYNLRHTCVPGMTGWAAVHGLRGNTSLEDRLDYDLYYIENWSLLLDFRIMLMTLAPQRNAY